VKTRPLLLSLLLILLAALNAAAVANAIANPADSLDATAIVVAVDGLVFALWPQMQDDESRRR
jgi:hypothetical protein